MLLWISAAGFAGAGWFGWLLWQDYDWSSVRIPNTLNRTGSAHSRPSVADHEDEPIDLYTSELLGATQTQWAGYQHTTTPPDQQEPIPPQVPTADEDFVVVGAEPAQSEAEEQTESGTTTNEDFVVIGSSNTPSGVSPFYKAADDDEDFVVVQEPDGATDELPEVDLEDYVENRTPIVPKIAALISHELWPQLRSYLQSLPQFGDTNLVQVVNAVAEDVGIGAASTGGVGEESAQGFAFYATLFDDMAQEAALAEV